MKTSFFVVSALAAMPLCACREKPTTLEGEAGAAAPKPPDSSTPSASAATPPGNPFLVRGRPTGFEMLDSGALLRTARLECPIFAPRAAVECGPKRASDRAFAGCVRDEDCTQAPYGHCERGAAPSCRCVYGCKTDSDCAAGEVCECGDPVGHCTKGDCGADGVCGGKGCLADLMPADSLVHVEFSCRGE